MPTAARSYLRAQGLPTSMASLGPGPGPVIDSAFTAPEFDIKAWINAALDSYPRQPTPSSQPAVASSSPSSTLATDASLDASLDLLQTPALDPVLDEKSQENQDLTSTSSLVTSPLTSLSSRKDGPSGQTQLQGSPSSLVSTSASQSQTTLLTQHATSHLTKLHLYANQISTALTSVTQDMVKTLPRLGHELDQLRQETSLLQEGIKLVRNDIHSIDSSDTAQALDRLKYLDLVKTRMEATHASLREAENWRNLEAEANEILARGDFIKAATRLSEAERSLVVYKNTNVEGDRMALLLVLKDQLEQQVKAKVKEALEQKDTAACQMLISVFGLIGRRDRFQEYYIAQRRAFLLTQWKRSMDILSIGTSVPGSSLTGTSGEPKDFVGALQTFYNDASTMLHDEFTWITSIFADPPATIHSLVHDIFTRIDPNMHTSLRHIVRSLGDEGSLPVVIAAFTVTESFGTRMERIVTQPLIGNQRERSGSIVAPRGMGTRARSGTLFAQNNHHLQPQAQSKDSTGNTGPAAITDNGYY
ncbi:hypothetical protein BGW38_004671 [Lunasporangiospora selenospora]|uniref:Conserved oligomeric Golgi complex subunit 7 n=1 Tax=Lunasporangiospora selenospora TaxID=979761 RepID=A0A9P6KHL7_9FUNG|nr:hypothetical protein BGW38_004671 [Lunasporangiospora selenospora]